MNEVKVKIVTHKILLTKRVTAGAPESSTSG